MTLEEMVEKYHVVEVQANGHRVMHETIMSWTANHADKEEMIQQRPTNEEEMDRYLRCQKAGTFIELRVYPETSIGFHETFAPTLAEAVALMNKELGH